MYHSNCADYKTIQAAYLLQHLDQELLADIGQLISFDIKKADIPSYVAWVNEWKTTYLDLSNIITDLKNQVGHVDIPPDDFTKYKAKALHLLRILANTMLNARIYAKDARRLEDAKYNY